MKSACVGVLSIMILVCLPRHDVLSSFYTYIIKNIVFAFVFLLT